MYSILHTSAEGDLYQLGPFPTQEGALKEAGKAHQEGDLDLDHDVVYLLTPDHTLHELDRSVTAIIREVQ